MGAPNASASATDTAALIVAGGSFLTAIGAVLGKGLAWLFRQRRSRITGLERAVEKLGTDMAKVIENCANERLESTRKIDCLVRVCIVLIDGGSHATHLAKQVLGTEFPDLLRRIYPAEQFADTPDDMKELLEKASAAPTPRRRRRA